MDALFPSFKTLRINDRIIDLSGPILMGVINATPDSFFEGTRTLHLEQGMKLAEKMIHEGVTILDVGGHSTRPGADPVSSVDELARVLPFINALQATFPEIILSIDTYRLEVAQQAIRAGAHIFNDIGGGKMDTGIFEWVADAQIPYILTHSLGRFEQVHDVQVYNDVVESVWNLLAESVQKLRGLGLKDLIIDLGFGFSKSLDQNYALLAALGQFKHLGCPILVGLSRKSMIYKLLETSPEEALNGSTVLNTVALLSGASILRVHDVKEAKEVIQIIEKLKENGISDLG